MLIFERLNAIVFMASPAPAAYYYFALPPPFAPASRLAKWAYTVVAACARCGE